MSSLQADRHSNLISLEGGRAWQHPCWPPILMTTMRRMATPAAVIGFVLLVVLITAASAISGYAQSGLPEQQTSDVTGPPPDRATQIDQLRRAAARLPIAAGLAVILALRPRRKGTPHR